MLILIFFVQYLSAADLVKVKSILTDPNQFNNEIVGIIGIVSQLQDEKDADRGYYFLKDSWGDTIKIATENDFPIIDNLYEIEGSVYMEGEKAQKKIFIVEMARRKIKNLKIDAKPSTRSRKNTVMVLFGIALFILIVIVIVIIFLSMEKRKSNFSYSTPEPFDSEISNDSPYTSQPNEDNSNYEDNAIKMIPPPDGTLKVIPGKLVIVRGYNVIRDISFWSEPGQEETLFAFGRDPAPSGSFWYTQLKSATVSSKQATFLFKNKKFILINYSITPPSLVNGVPMELHQSITLKNGDLIKMGQFVFVYYEIDSRSLY